MNRIKKLFRRIRKIWRQEQYTITLDPKYIPRSEVKKRLQELKKEMIEKYEPKNNEQKKN